MQQKREQVRNFLQKVIEKYGEENIKKLDFELGIDEAGRGPVFGTMVYSALWWPVELKEDLQKLGFDDSKALTEEQRERLLELIDILKDKIIFYELRKISATEISTNMNNLKYNINLNELSHNAALELTRRAYAQGFNVTHIYADTVGDPTKYTNFLKENLKEHSHIFKKISCEPKADATYKVVSASSICAKVNRDRIITEWKFAENIAFKGELGSGYPGDPKTKKWLADNSHPIFGYPTLILKMKVNQDDSYETKYKKLNYLENNKAELQRDLWTIVTK